MTIKTDKRNKEMAANHGMIEPFAESQIRHSDGNDLISYGTSSFGYDVRCATEFKVFTNIHSAVVDPKHFDEKSGDCVYCPEGTLQSLVRYRCDYPCILGEVPVMAEKRCASCPAAIISNAVGGALCDDVDVSQCEEGDEEHSEDDGGELIVDK